MQAEKILESSVERAPLLLLLLLLLVVVVVVVGVVVVVIVFKFVIRATSLRSLLVVEERMSSSECLSL